MRPCPGCRTGKAGSLCKLSEIFFLVQALIGRQKFAQWNLIPARESIENEKFFHRASKSSCRNKASWIGWARKVKFPDFSLQRPPMMATISFQNLHISELRRRASGPDMSFSTTGSTIYRTPAPWCLSTMSAVALSRTFSLVLSAFFRWQVLGVNLPKVGLDRPPDWTIQTIQTIQTNPDSTTTLKLGSRQNWPGMKSKSSCQQEKLCSEKISKPS